MGRRAGSAAGGECDLCGDGSETQNETLCAPKLCSFRHAHASAPPIARLSGHSSALMHHTKEFIIRSCAHVICAAQRSELALGEAVPIAHYNPHRAALIMHWRCTSLWGAAVIISSTHTPRHTTQLLRASWPPSDPFSTVFDVYSSMSSLVFQGCLKCTA